MRCGKKRNKYLLRLKFLILTFLLFCSCAFSVACQTKEQKIDLALKSCQVLLDKDDVAAAYKCYLKVGKTYPENDAYITKIGDEAIFKKCGEWKDNSDFENAVVCYEGLTRVRPDNANIRFLLARSYYQYAEVLSGDTRNLEKKIFFLEKAESVVKKGLEIKSNDAWGISIYGDVLELKGDSYGALLKYQEAVKLEPESELYWIKLARSQEFKYPAVAIDSYKQALGKNPNSKPALYYLGLLYERQFEICKAVETLERLFKLDPNYDDADERLEVIKKRFDIKLSCQDKSNPSRKKSKTVGTTNLIYRQ